MAALSALDSRLFVAPAASEAEQDTDAAYRRAGLTGVANDEVQIPVAVEIARNHIPRADASSS